MTMQNRRNFIKVGVAAGANLALAGCAGMGGTKSTGRLVVVGGGYAGATVAKYVNLWSGGAIEVTLVERNTKFVSCPISNLVLGGIKGMDDITHGYDGLAARGIRVVYGEVTGIDTDKRSVALANGESLPYDRLVIAPGVDFMLGSVPGLTRELSETKFLHAWKAGPQTVALRKQLEAMPDGGVFAVCIPKAPFRCPPGPYERACMVAHYFKQQKPKSKVLVLDANPDILSKKGLFLKAWDTHYKGIVEYRKEQVITELDAASGTVKFQSGSPVKANVLNIIPAQMAGALAKPFVNANGRWVDVNWLTLETEVAKNVHVIGDATNAAALMPKSGHMANQQAKVAAAAIINLMSGLEVNAEPVVTNTCYSFVAEKSVVHVSSVHAYNASEKTFETVPGAGGLSAAANELEAKFAMTWAKNIWADMLT